MKLIEVGCSSGALAREFKRLSPGCHYLGVEIDEDYTALARRHCDEAITLDIETADGAFWASQSSRDCWIFGDTLEHLRDPWEVLRKIREVIPGTGSIVACIPNAQHWSMQVRLSLGDFRYQKSGLLDRTHLRWFTRRTILDLFATAGFTVVAGYPRIFDEPERATYLPLIAQLAEAAGGDPKSAVEDCKPLQFVVRAIPR